MAASSVDHVELGEVMEMRTLTVIIRPRRREVVELDLRTPSGRTLRF